MDKPDEVDWQKVGWMSAIGGLGPILLGLWAKRQYRLQYEEANRPRWTDAARWERKGRDY